METTCSAHIGPCSCDIAAQLAQLTVLSRGTCTTRVRNVARLPSSEAAAGPCIERDNQPKGLVDLSTSRRWPRRATKSLLTIFPMVCCFCLARLHKGAGIQAHNLRREAISIRASPARNSSWIWGLPQVHISAAVCSQRSRNTPRSCASPHHKLRL